MGAVRNEVQNASNGVIGILYHNFKYGIQKWKNFTIYNLLYFKFRIVIIKLKKYIPFTRGTIWFGTILIFYF